MADSLESTQVQLNVKDGVASIEQGTPLTRLHYFDGKFLRADALTLEQDYHRNLVRLANLAGGWGVVNGLGLALSGGTLTLSAGLAVTPAGSSVLLTGAASFAIKDLLAAAQPAPANPTAGVLGGAFNSCSGEPPASIATSANTGYYEITAGPIEGLCGNEEVYGKLCETACVSDSQSPYWKEGLVLRLRPIALNLPVSSAVPDNDGNLRSRVASAYFAAEPWLTSSLLSSAGLNSATWCNPASLYTRDEVPLGLLVANGSSTLFIDAWSARRERMDTQARGYWQGRMAMRPWNVFLAQILQFQCQLAGLFASTGGVITPPNSCDSVRDLLEKTRAELAALHSHYSTSTAKILQQFGDKPNKKDAQSIAAELKLSYSELFDIAQKLDQASAVPALPSNRLLLNSGFIELPPAGYLPVVPGTNSLQKQLALTFGEGVQLTYHAVRQDEIGHLLEEAQHLQRISLTRGLDDAQLREPVEIFVPDGAVFNQQTNAPGTWWQVDMELAALGVFDLGLNTMELGSLAAGSEVKTQVLEQASAAVLATAEAAAPAAVAAPAGTAPPAGSAPPAAPATTPAPAAESDDLEAVSAELRKLTRAFTQRSLRGLARTEARADGSFGLTLISTLDISDLVQAIAKLLQEHPQVDPNGAFAKRLATFTSVSLYLAGDLLTDPLELAIGASAALSGELNLSNAFISLTGSLTILFDRPAAGGGTERVAQLNLLVTDAKGKVSQSQGRISLLREGSGGSGELVLDDAEHDPTNSPNFFTWSRNPRKASLSVLAAAKRESVSVNLMRRMTGELSGFNSLTNNSPTNTSTAPAAEAEADLERKTLVSLYGLPAMPELSSPLGAAALNALIQIADANNDPAFLARARARLFPNLDQPGGTGVKAVLDWVLFRRARTLLCCAANAPVASGLEAFQVWHVKLADAAAVQQLSADLDSRDPSALARYKFQRVAVLRYRDANPVSEESAAQVLSLWQPIKPAPQVVLGRYWEQAPSSGQSWQNHLRLANMLDQITALTTPPTRGTGAISRLENPLPPLTEGGLDGGFLVATLATKLQLRPQRVLLLPFTYHANLRPLFDTEPDGAWKQLLDIVARDTVRSQDLTLPFTAANQLEAASLAKLQDADRSMMSVRTDFGFELWFMRINAASIDSGIDPAVRHQAVVDNLGKAGTVIDRHSDGSFTLSATDLGGGSQTASVVFYNSIVEVS